MSGTVNANTQAGSTKQGQMSPLQQNAAARSLIFSRAKPILQLVTTKTFATLTPGTAAQVVVNPLQVGFLRRFLVEITGTITNTTSGVALSKTANGTSNLLKNVTFNDFTGNPRHNCSGRSIDYVEAYKYGRIPGAATTSDNTEGYGSNYGSNAGPNLTVSGGATPAATFTRVFEIPIMQDTGQQMAGGLWLGTNNQTTLLTLTLQDTLAVASTGDPLTAVLQGTTAGAITFTQTAFTVTVWQEYWNNVPVDKNNNPILPGLDISTAYMITETNSGLSFSSGNPAYWNFPTFSKLLGTYFCFDNGAVALNAGTDISAITLQVSNYSIIKQYTPTSLSRICRDIVGADFPSGSYGIPSRQHPYDVSQYPSLQLQITPTGTINAGTYSLITTELLRRVQYLAAASGVGGA
jgi:hypothetical protein